MRFSIRLGSQSYLIIKRHWQRTLHTESSASDTPLTIQAAVARAPKTAFTIEKLKLRPPRSDEVLVRVVATGICHTDIAVKERNLCSFPIVLGHEGVGVIERVGYGVNNFQTGDHVIMSYASCGICPHCLIGKPSYCYQHGSLNFSGTHPDGSTSYTSKSEEKIYGSFFQQSSLANWAIASPRNLVKVSKDLDLPSLAPLGCGIQTGAGCVINSLKCSPNSSLAIFGCGAVGLSAILAAKTVGVKRIIAIDLKSTRLDLAQKFGATDRIQSKIPQRGKDVKQTSQSDLDIVMAIQSLTDGLGVNYSIDTSGNKHVLRTAVDSLSPLGTAAVIGGSDPGTEVSLDMLSLLNGKKLRGVIQGDSVSQVFIPFLIQLHKEGRFPYTDLITYYDGLEKINEACEAAVGADGKVIKPVIRIS